MVEGLQLLEKAAELDSSDFNAQVPALLELSKRLQQSSLLEVSSTEDAARMNEIESFNSWSLYQQLALNSISRSIDGIVIVKQADVVFDHFRGAFLYNAEDEDPNTATSSSSSLSTASTMTSVADEVREFLMRVLSRSIGIDIRPIPENMFDLYFYSHLFLPVGPNVVIRPGGDQSWYRNYAQSAKVILSSRLLFRKIGESLEDNYVAATRHAPHDDVEDGRILANLETYRRAMLLCGSFERFISDSRSRDVKGLLACLPQDTEGEADDIEIPLNVALVDKLLFDTPSFMLPPCLRPQDSLWEHASVFTQNDETHEIMATLYDLCEALLALDAARSDNKTLDDTERKSFGVLALPEPKMEESVEFKLKSSALRMKSSELRLQMYREVLGAMSNAQYLRPRIILEQVVSTYRSFGADVPSLFRQLRDSLRALNILLCTVLQLDPNLIQDESVAAIACPLSDEELLKLGVSTEYPETKRLILCYRVVWNLFCLSQYVIEGRVAEGKDSPAFIDIQSRALSAVANAGSIFTNCDNTALSDLRLCVLSVSQVHFMSAQLRKMISEFETTGLLRGSAEDLNNEGIVSEISRAMSGMRGPGYLHLRSVVALYKNLTSLFELYSRVSSGDLDISELNEASTLKNDGLLASCIEMRSKLASFTEQYFASDDRMSWIVERYEYTICIYFINLWL